VVDDGEWFPLPEGTSLEAVGYVSRETEAVFVNPSFLTHWLAKRWERENGDERRLQTLNAALALQIGIDGNVNTLPPLQDLPLTTVPEARLESAETALCQHAAINAVINRAVPRRYDDFIAFLTAWMIDDEAFTLAFYQADAISYPESLTITELLSESRNLIGLPTAATENQRRFWDNVNLSLLSAQYGQASIVPDVEEQALGYLQDSVQPYTQAERGRQFLLELGSLLGSLQNRRATVVDNFRLLSDVFDPEQAGNPGSLMANLSVLELAFTQVLNNQDAEQNALALILPGDTIQVAGVGGLSVEEIGNSVFVGTLETDENTLTLELNTDIEPEAVIALDQDMVPNVVVNTTLTQTGTTPFEFSGRIQNIDPPSSAVGTQRARISGSPFGADALSDVLAIQGVYQDTLLTPQTVSLFVSRSDALPLESPVALDQSDPASGSTQPATGVVFEYLDEVTFTRPVLIQLRYPGGLVGVGEGRNTENCVLDHCDAATPDNALLPEITLLKGNNRYRFSFGSAQGVAGGHRCGDDAQQLTIQNQAQMVFEVIWSGTCREGRVYSSFPKERVIARLVPDSVSWVFDFGEQRYLSLLNAMINITIP
jgi:hypothetical protein